MGNGDVESGEGYLYRGRGLIQLTGKTNYRRFSNWIEEDVVAAPDLVAGSFAVHSAVFYWTVHNINALADIDDIRQVTKKINGGYNGLPDRVQLLDRAKQIVGVDAQTMTLEGATHTVKAPKLNLRNRPKVIPSTLIGTLNQGTRVKKLADADKPGWIKVRTILNGQIYEGYVSGHYLRPIPGPAIAAGAPPPAPPETLPAAHLSENRRDISRSQDWGRAYPLGEADRVRRTASNPDTKARQLIKLTNYLDSENPHHRRYWPKQGSTYCNIYAYDYCYLAGVYMPRVWWKDSSLRQIRNGLDVDVLYGVTVHELNANMLYNWFEDYGTVYEWKRVLNLDILQAAANKGEVCIIVAQHRDSNRSGHIAAAVPEHEHFAASRRASGEVLCPLQTQAGAANHRFFTGNAWWRKSQFHAFSFWRHE
jgi:hypothetical protein